MNPLAIKKRIYHVFLSSFLFFLLVFSSWQCFEVPEDPVMPTWTTQFSVPLIDTVFFLNDALKENPDILQDGSYYVYHPKIFQFDSVTVGDRIALTPNASISFQKTIGTFDASMNAPIEVFVSTETIIGSAPPPNPTPVPSFSWQSHLDLPAIPVFETVHLQSGNFSLQIKNSLPVQIDLPSGMSVLNQDNSVVATFSNVSIPAHSTWAPAPASLANITMDNNLKVAFNVSSQGSNGNSVQLYADSGLTASVQITDAVADQIQATSFKRLDFSSSFNPFVFDDSTYFQQATFKKGRFRLQIQNALQLGLTAQISMNEFRSISTNQPFLLTIPLNANTTVTNDIDLTQWKLVAPNNGIANALTCSLRVSSSTLSSSTPITLNATDQVQLTVQALDTPFIIKSVSGVSKPILLNITDTVKLDVGKLSTNFNADSVLLNTLKMKMNLYSGGGFPVDLTLTLNGLNASNSVIATTTLQPNGGSPNPNAFRLQPSVHDTLTFKNLHVFISNYLTHRGERLIIKGNALLNPYDVYATRQIGTVADTSSFHSSFDVSTHLSIGILNGVFTDTLDEDGDDGDKIDKDILDRIKQATVYFRIENAIPMGVEIDTKFLDASNNTLLNLPQIGATPIKIDAGSVASPTVTLTPIRIGISTSDAEKFNDTKRIIANLKINSNGQTRMFTSGDYIRVRAYANIVVKVSE